MAWISPTGHNDPDVKWVDETYAYDDDTGTRARNFQADYNHYLELTHSAITCDKIRIYAHDYTTGNYYDPDIDIDVYYGSAWHNIFSGTVTKDTWVEKQIGSTESITAARVKSNTSSRELRLYEFDFNKVLVVETDACSNPTPSSLQANGDIVSDGGLTVTRRGFHYTKVYDGFEWGVDTDPLSDSGGNITWTISVAGTSKAEIDTTYHYSGTRSARLYRDGANTALAKFTQAAIGSSQVLAVRFRKDSTGTRWYFGQGNGSYLIHLYLKETDNTLYYYDGSGHSVVVVSLDEWHLLSLHNVNWVAGTFDIYLDGILVKSSAAMLSDSGYENEVYTYVSVAGTGEVAIDEIAVWDVEDESGSFGEGEYDLEISGLDPATSYQVQAFAENADGIAYGSVVTCSTTALALAHSFGAIIG